MKKGLNKNKFQKWQAAGLVLAAFSLLFGFDRSSAQVAAGNARQINISAYIVNQANKEIVNGDYSVRFAIYSVDRETSDPYPSDADSARRVWSETQTVKLRNGFLDAFVGAVNPLPEGLNFTTGIYYLGIRVNSDSEMVPRKRIGATPLAFNSFQLQGAEIGTQEGDIPLLGPDGLLDVSMVPSVTDLGTISNGVWEADPIADDFIDSALTGKTYNGLSLTSNADGFSIAGGSVERTLTLSGGNVTLGTPGPAGSVMYSNGSAYSFTDLGSTGQVLLSSGTGMPTWGTVTGGAGGIITADSLDFTEFSDAMILDNNLTIDTDGNSFVIDGTLEATSLIISGEATIGILGVNLTSNTSIIPSTAGLNLGSATNHWSDIYVDNLSVGGTDMNGTTAEYFAVNTDSVADENMGLRFYRSVLNGYASLVWDAGTSRFNLFKRENTAEYANLSLADLYASGNVGIGTTAPGAKLEVVGDVISKGTAWTARTSVAGDNDSWASVAYGNGLFVAVGEGATDKIMTSPDGINWTVRSTGSALYTSVAYGNGLFVAVARSGARIATSPDGITWTERSVADDNDDWGSVTYGKGLFVAVNSTGSSGDNVVTSPDGINWTVQAVTEVGNWRSVTYGNGLFVAVGDSGTYRAMTSPDGINWTAVITGGISDDFVSVTYGNGLFVAVGYSADERLITSPDGVTWTHRDVVGNDDTWAEVTYGNGLFVAVGSSGDRVMTSPDGITWTVRSAAGNDDSWTGVSYGNGMFVAVSGFGNRVMTSGKTESSLITGNNNYQGGMNIFGNVGIGTTAPTASLQIKAGTTAANTAPLKFTAGTNMTTAEAGAFEYDGSELYFTPSGTTRETVAYLSDLGLGSQWITTGSDIYYNTGNVGIGDVTPDNLLEIMSSGAANTQFTISNTNAGNYNPQIGFELADGTNLFTMGIDDSDSDKFKIYSGTNISGTSEFSIDADGLVSISNLEMGAQVFADDSGAVSWIDMGVTSGATIGTVESYSAQLDGNPMVTIYGESDGAGGIQNTRIGVRTTSPLATLHLDGTDTKFRIEDDNLPQLDFYDDTTYEGFINTNGSDMYVRSVTGNLYLGTVNSVSDLRISGASGNVGIGISPTARLHLGGVAGTVSFEVNSNETTAGSNVLALRSDVAGADDLIFRVQADGAVFADGAYTGTGADYAEYFETTDTDLTSGEAVCIDPQKENAVKRCVRSADNNLMGIISSRPSIVGNNRDNRKNDPNYKIVAMLGQTPGRVSAENGTIQIGDSLTSAAIPGHLRKADPGESTVGVALQNFSGTQGSIQILISRKNKSLTVEKVEEAVSQRIAEMNVEDQVNALISQAKAELDQVSETRFAAIDNQLANQQNLIAILQIQVDELKARLNTEANLAQIDLNAQDAQFIKLLLGVDRVTSPEDVDILGRLSAKNLATGGIEIVIVDPEAKTIGEDVIPADGSVVFVATKAVTKSSKIYITPIGSTDNQVIYVGVVQEAAGFEVTVDRLETVLVPKEIRFNWWIVEAK